MSEPLRLGDLGRPEPMLRRLQDAGLSRTAARGKSDLFARAGEALAKDGVAPDAPVRAFFVPGRIEVLGKHTDYAGGRSIVAATEQGFCLAAAARDDAGLWVSALDLDDQAKFELSGDLAPPVGHWSNYPMTVARRVARNFAGPLRGAHIAFAGDLPPAAGMSSSSALMVGVFLVLSGVNALCEREEYRREIASLESLGEYLGTVENGQSYGSLAGDKGVGTFGGSEDHTAILCCRTGELSQYSYCPVRLERRITMPEGFVFAVASSGVEAAKTGQAMDKYNRASCRASATVAAWNEATGRSDPHIAAALASGDGAAERMRKILAELPDRPGSFSAEDLQTRFEHFVIESERIIPGAGDLLEAGALGMDPLGPRVDVSQQVAEILLGNQIPETVFLAGAARRGGAAAASAFGAGFGGSVWAMVREDRVEAFLKNWRAEYAAAYPGWAEGAEFFLTRPGPAAFGLT